MAIKTGNRKVIKKISRASVMANGRRNIAAITAVILTATLFTTLFTVGGSLLSAFQEATMKQVGTRAHAGFKFLTQKQYDLIASDPYIVDISYNIIAGSAENPELQKIYTEVRYTEEKCAEWGFCKPTTGTLPAKKYDVATNTNVLDALGIPHELGSLVTLELESNGIHYILELNLCGLWEGDIALGANEIFISRELCDEIAPVITVPLYDTDDQKACFDGSINPSFWFRTSWDIEGQMDALKQRLSLDPRMNDGINWAYAASGIDATSVLMLTVILLLIASSCYLIIYNIFEITVSKDIRFYGLLKTIGTTGRQLRSVVRRQALILSAAGIPIGLLAGFIIGRLIMPVVIASTSLSELDHKAKINPVIFIAAAVFALATVLISCARPCRIAGKVSPVEAVRWTGVTGKSTSGKKLFGQKKTRRHVRKCSPKKDIARTHKVTPLALAIAGMNRDRRKLTSVILSLTLSLVLLNGTYTLVNGFDADKFLESSVVTDFALTDSSLRTSWDSTKILDGVPMQTIADISALSEVTEVGAVYCNTSKHILSDTAYKNALEIVERNSQYTPSPYYDSALDTLREGRKLSSFVYGIDESLWDKIEIDGGNLDADAFATGDYVIATGFWEDSAKDPWYDIGDDITIIFDNGRQKTYKVMAIGEIPYALSQRFSYPLDIGLTLPSDEYLRRTDAANPMSVGFNVGEGCDEAVEKWCENYTETEAANLVYESKATRLHDFKGETRMFSVIGGVLTAILALIGIINFANAVITSVDARRKEFATLQSVGMSSRQLMSQLICEGLIYAVLTLILAATLGNLLMLGLIALISQDMWFFTWHFSMLPLVCCMPALLAVSIAIPAAACRSMCQMTIVERLREAE